MQDYLYAAQHQWRAVQSKPSPNTLASGDRCPVVIVPGVYERWQFLWPTVARIHGAGHPVYTVDRLARNTDSIPRSARCVAEFITERNLSNVVLVAHSKGGLIGKFVMLNLDVNARVVGMIAVATPFLGSGWARYMLAPSLRAFSSHDPHISALHARHEVNSRITSIYAAFDPHIPEGCALPGARNIRINTGGHFRLLDDPRAITAMMETLATY
ncbi:esterase/lipase family protein [Cryobacterium frigoriphilum]|nr:alpha/beta hydrolase [Cryobacterium frigoriphilum]